jgi:hypothetical protein
VTATSRKKLMITNPVSPEEVAYPRDTFTAILLGGSPYAFYLFQWVPYHTDARRFRLKMMHDVKLFDGTELESCYPNGNAFHGKIRVEDKDVEFIRISKKQRSFEYADLRDAPEEVTDGTS